MLARDYCTDPVKPIILSHHMLLGMKQGQAKMSKSDPDSAIFMEDSVQDVQRKINKAYCPEKIVEENPILDYVKHIIMPAFDDKFEVGEKLYTSYAELEAEYTSGELHPSTLKPACIKAINQLLQPVRDHFENDAYAKNLLETIKRW